MTKADLGSTSSTHGLYMAHCMYVVTHSLFNLDSTDDEPLPGAVPIHAHEYIHYLHNISTCAGAQLFLANLWILRSLPHGTDEFGHFLGDKHLNKEQRHWVAVASTWIHALWGGMKWSDDTPTLSTITTWRFDSVQRRNVRLDLSEQSYQVELAAIAAEVTDNNGTAARLTIDIGYNFISEGVAFEVERELLRANGVIEADIDKGTPVYPYLTYRPLLDHLVGRPTTSRERIDLGVFALMTTSPASTLIGMCEHLGHVARIPERNGRLPASVTADVALPFKENAMNFVSQTIDKELSALGSKGHIAEGAREIAALFTAGFALRTINSVLEQTFVGIRLGAHEFKQIIGSLLPDYCVLQKKTGNRVEYQWIGPGIVGPDTAPIGVFQAAMHFSELHLRRGELISTDRLPEIRCPYSGGCQSEIDDGYPEDCRTKPWRRFMSAKAGQPTCWYAQGVKSFIRDHGESSENE
jgi:hypothetical protein